MVVIILPPSSECSIFWKISTSKRLMITESRFSVPHVAKKSVSHTVKTCKSLNHRLPFKVIWVILPLFVPLLVCERLGIEQLEGGLQYRAKRTASHAENIRITQTRCLCFSVIGYSQVNYFHKVVTCFGIEAKVKIVTFLFSKFSRLEDTEGIRIGAKFRNLQIYVSICNLTNSSSSRGSSF